MKKVFIIILAITVILCNCTAFAEEQFSIRNNVQFGDSPETVKEKDEAVKDKEAKEFKVLDTYYYPAHLPNYNVELAGLKASLDYCFDDTGLKEVYYVIIKDNIDATNVTPSQFYDVYYVLKQSLIEKYGPTLDKNDVRATVLLGNYMKDNCQATVNGVNSFTGQAYIFRAVEFDSWLLEYDNYYVKIDLNYIDPGTDKRFTIYLSYCKFTKDEYETLLADFGDMVEQYRQSIDNSI